MVNFYDRGDIEDERAIGWNSAQWITKDVVRFTTFDGVKDVYLNFPSINNPEVDVKQQGKEETKENTSFPSISISTEEIESIIKMAENKEDGQAIEINGNRLEVRYDKLANERMK